MLTNAYLRFSLAAAALACACDPGYHIDISVEVPEDVVSSYSEAHRGLLLLRRDHDDVASLRAWGVVCGGAAILWESAVDDLGFAPEATVTAWIETLPADDARPCGASEEFLADERRPDADAPQGEAQVREGDTMAAVEIVLAFPGE